MLSELMRPAWDAPATVGAAMSTRQGGVSRTPFDSLNLRPAALPGDVSDDTGAIAENQRRFAETLGAQPVYLNQVHGADVVRLQGPAQAGQFQRADASVTTVPGLACTVLVADCLPVLFCSDDGRAVAAAHAGWRGLAAGVLENTVLALCDAAACAPRRLLAWLGPCIGPRQFEVGADVLAAFGEDVDCFIARARADGSPRWRADLPALARRRLAAAGVLRVQGGQWCTVEDPLRFFSYRRDGVTGRLAAAVWLEPRPHGARAAAPASP